MRAASASGAACAWVVHGPECQRLAVQALCSSQCSTRLDAMQVCAMSVSRVQFHARAPSPVLVWLRAAPGGEAWWGALQRMSSLDKGRLVLAPYESLARLRYFADQQLQVRLLEPRGPVLGGTPMQACSCGCSCR